MLKALKRRWQSGDTLIEVLFAVTVFSLVVVTSLTLMNQGTSASIRSLQITLVRQEIDNQAATLRFLNSSYITAYYDGYAPTGAPTTPAEQYYQIIQDIKTQGATSVSAFGGGGQTCQVPPAGSFVVNSHTAAYQKYDTTKISSPDTYSQVVYDPSGALTTSKGLWIEAVRSTPAGGTSYTDFHIRACWYSPGAGQPMNLGTIVRLYEPAK